VNLLVCSAYLTYLILKHKPFVRDNLHKFALVVGAALLLNAYIILPLLALGTLDKGEISDGVNNAPVDYTALVDIANTGDIFTALSLSKGVLKDYEFYGAATWPFYFLGVFGLYILLLGTYVYVEKRLKAIADLTRGEYFYAGNATDLKKVYQSLHSKLVMEKKETEITAIFSAIAAATVLLAAGLSLLWFNRIL
jgi:hypothetical protein